jgi:hypothetical protein
MRKQNAMMALIGAAKKYRSLLQNATEEEKLNIARTLLNIDEKKFAKLSSTEKQNFLNYKATLIHFELAQVKFPTDPQDLEQIKKNQEDTELIRKLAKESKALIESKLSKQEDCKKCTRGLSSLYMRSAAGLSDSVMPIGNINAGIEPKFKAAHHQDVVEYLLRTYKDDEDGLITFINRYEGDIKKIYELFDHKLAFYMYKPDYFSDEQPQKEPGSTDVSLNYENVLLSGTVKKIFDKYGKTIGYFAAQAVKFAKDAKASKINTDAIIETLSTALASCFMEVPDSQLYLTEHKNKSLKFMIQARWLEDVEEFGSEENPLRGGGQDDETNNYRPRMLVKPRGEIISLTDNRISNLPRYLIPLILFGDPDKIGSRGQNLLIQLLGQDKDSGQKIYQLIGIDFGHTLQEKNNPVLETLLPDGRFTQPNGSFKNLSALTDGSLKQKMEGVLILAKLLHGEKGVDSTIINSYGSDFAKYWNSLPSGEDKKGEAEKICDSYLQAFRDLKENDEENAAEYDIYINAIENFKKRLLVDLTKILKKFESYLKCEAKLIELVDILNLHCAGKLKKTSLCSNDGTHALEHVRIHPDYKATWAIKKEGDVYILSCRFSPDNLKKIKSHLAKFLPKQGVTFQYKGKELLISFKKDQLQPILNQLKKTSIEKRYHSAQYLAKKEAKAEIALQNIIQSPWFTQNMTKIDFNFHPRNSDNPYEHYRICFASSNATIERLIKQEFGILTENKQLIVDFGCDIDSIHNMKVRIERIHQEYQKLTLTVLSFDASSLDNCLKTEFFWNTINFRKETYHDNRDKRHCFITSSKEIDDSFHQYISSKPNHVVENLDSKDVKLDTSLLLSIYGQIHKKALKNPDVEIIFDFYTSSDEIFKKLHVFFTKYPEMIPCKVSFQLHLYKTEINQRKLEIIRGKRELPDEKYEQTILEMKNLCQKDLKETDSFCATEKISPENLKEFIQWEKTLSYLRHNLTEFRENEKTLSKEAELVVKALETIDSSEFAQEENTLLENAKKHYGTLAQEKDLWADLIPEMSAKSEQDIFAIFQEYNHKLANTVKEKIYNRLLSCGWVTLNFMKLNELVKKQSAVIHNQLKSETNLPIDALLITPVQRLPRLGLYSTEWEKKFSHFPENHPGKLAVQSIKNKFKRILSTLQELVQAVEKQNKSSVQDLEKPQEESVLKIFLSLFEKPNPKFSVPETFEWEDFDKILQEKFTADFVASSMFQNESQEQNDEIYESQLDKMSLQLEVFVLRQSSLFAVQAQEMKPDLDQKTERIIVSDSESEEESTSLEEQTTFLKQLEQLPIFFNQYDAELVGIFVFIGVLGLGALALGTCGLGLFGIAAASFIGLGTIAAIFFTAAGSCLLGSAVVGAITLGIFSSSNKTPQLPKAELLPDGKQKGLPTTKLLEPSSVRSQHRSGKPSWLYDIHEESRRYSLDGERKRYLLDGLDLHRRRYGIEIEDISKDIDAPDVRKEKLIRLIEETVQKKDEELNRISLEILHNSPLDFIYLFDPGDSAANYVHRRLMRKGIKESMFKDNDEYKAWRKELILLKLPEIVQSIRASDQCENAEIKCTN